MNASKINHAMESASRWMWGDITIYSIICKHNDSHNNWIRWNNWKYSATQWHLVDTLRTCRWFVASDDDYMTIVELLRKGKYLPLELKIWKLQNQRRVLSVSTKYQCLAGYFKLLRSTQCYLLYSTHMSEQCGADTEQSFLGTDHQGDRWVQPRVAGSGKVKQDLRNTPKRSGVNS